MECYSEQTCALAVDGELAADEARRLRDHLATCRRCRELVDALRAENRVLSESLRELPEEAASPAGFSHLRRSWVWGDLAVMAAVLALGSIASIWFDELSIPAALEWFNPFSASGRTNLIFGLFDQFALGGTAMLTDYAAVVGFLSLLLLASATLYYTPTVSRLLCGASCATSHWMLPHAPSWWMIRRPEVCRCVSIASSPRSRLFGIQIRMVMAFPIHGCCKYSVILRVSPATTLAHRMMPTAMA